MEKKIKDYLHLYLGCRAKVIMAENSQSELPYYFSEDGIYKIEGVMLDFQSECESIKPILRPLSDMKEEEKFEFIDLVGIEKEDIGCLIKSPNPITGQMEFGTAHLTNVLEWAIGVKYLLSKNFDLFGLIDAGLAIDATKQEAKT